MNVLSAPVVAMAGISLYVGLYHLLIFIRRPQNRTDLTFALLCFTTVLYDAFCIGLYNATSVTEGVQWQRAQFIALAIFVPVFLWFVSDYTREKPGKVIYAYSIYYILVVIIQFADRSSLTFLVDQPSIKHIVLSQVFTVTYYEATPGLFSIMQGIVGMVASTYILILGIRYYKRGHKRDAMPLILAMGLIYATGFNDTMVSNGVYQLIYLIEYAYLAVILVMAYSLSTTIVETAIVKDELRRSEERFRSLVETINDWMWEVDANGIYTYASPKVRNLLGYKPEEVVGRTPFDFMPAEEAERVDALFQIALGNREPVEQLENICLHKDGRGVLMDTNGVPFFDENGNLAGYRGIDRDITERKKTEQTLQMFQYTVDQASDAVQWLNCDGGFDYVNDQACRSLGYTREEMMRLKLWDIDPLFPEKQWAQEWKRFQEMDQDTETKMESLHRRKDGSLFPVEVAAKHLLFGDKELHVAVARDITERKRAEEALQESEERYRRLVEVSPIPMWINKDGLITYMNPAALRTLGASKLDQVVGRPAMDFIHPDYHEVVKERISQMITEEKIAPLLEEKYVRLDGSFIDVEVIATPFTTSGGRAMQTLFQDITKRKLNEAEREALISDLETKNAELERFTYTVSHDLKSPLVTIKGFLGYIERDVATGNEERLKNDIRRISDAVERMRQLLNELLDFSRIGRIHNPSEIISFSDLAREAVALVQGRIMERGMEIRIDPSLPAVFGDKKRLLEVLQNLVDNAAKFMGDEQKPKIEIGWLGEDTEPGKPVFFVRDNGIGISPKYHEQVFGLFNKLHPNIEGTGIGLALVKRIVEFHGGRIWVESEAGKGSTFFFTLSTIKTSEAEK